VYDGLKFRVKIKLQGGSDIISNIATLTVSGDLTCTIQPKSKIVVEGGTLLLSADFTSSAQVICQWQYCPYGTVAWIDLPGENNLSLSVSNVRIDQSGGQFRVKAMSASGCGSTVSQAAFMEVVTKPLIQLNRGQESYCGGGSTQFTVKMRGGTGEEKIQWQESHDAGRSFKDIPGETDITYSINRITETMAGNKYRAFVKLPGGLELFTSDITITVHGAVAFNEQPRSQSICPGDTYVLEAKTAYKGSEPEYNWQISYDSIKFEDVPGGKSGRLELVSEPTDVRPKYYRALVKAGACESMVSDIARVNILSINGQEPKVQNALVAQGQTVAEILSDFNGDQEIYTVSWQWSANDGATWQTANSLNTNHLTLNNVTPLVEGTYLYRLKVLNKVCARISYSNPAKLIFQPTQ
jgi:hypothetical protein